MSAWQIVYLNVRHGTPSLSLPWAFAYPQLMSQPEADWAEALAADSWELVTVETLRREQHTDGPLIFGVAAERQLIFKRPTNDERDQQLRAARVAANEAEQRATLLAAARARDAALLAEEEARSSAAKRTRTEEARSRGIEEALGRERSTDGVADGDALTIRQSYIANVVAQAGDIPLPPELLQALVADSYWFWKGRGSRGDIQIVADEMGLTVSETTRIINAAGKSGLLEQRRPPGM